MVFNEENTRRNTELGMLILSAVPVLLLYAMYLTNMQVALSFASLSVPIGLFAAFGVAHAAIRKLAPAADPMILPLVFLLSGIGIAFVTRLAPELAGGQVLWLFISVAAMVAVLVAVPSLDELAAYKYTMGIVGIVLLLLPMLIGQERGGSKLWLIFGPFSFQPGEIAKLLVVLFLASYLAENREMLSASMIHVGPFSLPRPRMFFPMLIMWGISLLVVVFERDLGSALLFFSIFVIMLYVCTGRVSYVVVSLGLLAVGAFLCYNLFDHVQTRVNIWIDPFADAAGGGYQIVQSLFSLADGRLFGTGIGKGMPGLIPVVESDFIFSAIGEEMGLLGASAVLIGFMLLTVRGLTTAGRAKSDVSSFTAVGLTAALTVQAVLIVAGVTKLFPLTGVTLPFMSQGGSSLLASFMAVGLLLRAGDEGTGHETQMETVPTGIGPSMTQAPPSTGERMSQVLHGAHVRGRYGMLTPESGVLGRVALGNRLTALVTLFTIMFAALVTNLSYIQVVKAEEYQKYPNNNHTIAKSAHVQRGAIITYDGATLAESVLSDDGTYVRTYPQGAMASHTVGYLNQRYSASGIELLMNDTLTGRSDYSNWNNALYALAGVQTPGSSVVLTLNSQMQASVEAALEGRRGAIVVLDPSTGAVLAKASAPSFSYENIEEVMAQSSDTAGPLVDRAMNSFYTPGSTFKVLTLAAAIDSGTATLESSFPAPASIELGGANVVNIDEEAWESLSLREALAYSANTVYGQVGTTLGANSLVNYARLLGYGSPLGQDLKSVGSLMPEPSEMTEWETAWSACGQPVGEHESPAGPQTTVMQNAVMAAAIANGGLAMNPYLVDHILTPEGVALAKTQPRAINQVVSSAAAEQVKEAMLAVVEEGTGYAAAIEGVRVAGKTGTAETGSAINSLFVGFAPYEQPTLAISICIEGDPGEDTRGVATALAGQVLANCLNIQAAGAQE